MDKIPEFSLMTVGAAAVIYGAVSVLDKASNPHACFIVVVLGAVFFLVGLIFYRTPRVNRPETHIPPTGRDGSGAGM